MDTRRFHSAEVSMFTALTALAFIRSKHCCSFFFFFLDFKSLVVVELITTETKFYLEYLMGADDIFVKQAVKYLLK